MLSKNEIKEIKALGQKKFRDERGLFVVEGEKLVAEALRSGFEVVRHLRVEEIGEETMARISQLTHPSPALAVVRQPRPQPAPVISPDELVLALDGIRDPGNLGTIIRIADWFGIRQLLASHDTVELYNPKVVQATMGAIFRVNVCYCDLAQTLRCRVKPGMTPSDKSGMTDSVGFGMTEGGIVGGPGGEATVLSGQTPPAARNGSGFAPERCRVKSGMTPSVKPGMTLSDKSGMTLLDKPGMADSVGFGMAEGGIEGGPGGEATVLSGQTPPAARNGSGFASERCRIKSGMTPSVKPGMTLSDKSGMTDSVGFGEMVVYGTFLEGEDIYRAELTEGGIIVLGSEAGGISPEVAATVTRKLFIPPFPRDAHTSESLNVAVAAAITCSEFRRRQKIS